MISFRQWLLEYIAFAKGRDVDFTASNAIVFFSKEGKASYREEGRTHGEYSHAVKHYMEFQPGNALGFAAEIKGIVQKWEKEGGLDFIELVDENGRTLARGWNQVNQLARPLDWLCSLDYINDISVSKGRLSKLEVEKRRVGDKMRKLYDEEILERMKKAVDLDNMSAKDVARICRTNSVVKFRANKNEEYCLDLKDNAIMMMRKGMVTTFFKFSRRGQQAEVIQNFMRKKPYLEYNSPDVKKGFEMAVGR